MSPHVAPILLCVGCSGLAGMASAVAVWIRMPIAAWSAGLVSLANMAVALGHAVAWAELG